MWRTLTIIGASITLFCTGTLAYADTPSTGSNAGNTTSTTDSTDTKSGSPAAAPATADSSSHADTIDPQPTEASSNSPTAPVNGQAATQDSQAATDQGQTATTKPGPEPATTTTTAKPVITDSNNHAMGSSIAADNGQTASPLTNFKAEPAQADKPSLKFLAAAADDAPADLSSDDPSLPAHDAVDIASYQCWMTQADFKNMKAQGVKTIVIKITEGTGYTNSYAADFIKYARAAGLNIAAYHYVDSTANIAAEAAYFAKQSKALGLPANTVMIEDAEQEKIPGTQTPNKNWTTASQTFAATLKKAGFTTPRFYTAQSWAANGTMDSGKLGAKNMWIAQYFYGKPSKDRLKNTQYGAWQFSSQMYFTKASSRSAVDVSIDYASFFDKGAQPVVPKCDSKVNGVVCVYELRSTSDNFQLLTYNGNEVTSTTASGDWKYQGIAFYAFMSQQPGTIPVYRLANNNDPTEHFLTASAAEKNVLCKGNWTLEGIGFYAYPDTAVNNQHYTVSRLYKSGGGHVFTTDPGAADLAGFKSEGVGWTAPSGMAPAAAAPAGRQNIYRVSTKHGHFYTISLIERDSLLRNDSVYENVMATAPSKDSGQPVYRLYSAKLSRHLWTTSRSEKDSLVKAGWSDEGICWHNDAGTLIIYRLQKVNGTEDILTSNYDEAVTLVKKGDWEDKGHNFWDNSQLIGKQPIYRLCGSREHFYTASSHEALKLVRDGWSAEGIAWFEPTKGADVYRVYNPNKGMHFWTPSAAEKNHLVSLGWRDEGANWHTSSTGPAVYRLYNPNTSEHFWTLSKAEKNHLVSLGWRDEGIGWRAA